MQSLDKFNPEKIFAEVVAGRTPVVLAGRSAYFRHLTPFNRGDSSYYYEHFIKRCESIGVPTHEERLKKVKQTGEWSDEQENEYLNAQSYLTNLQKTVKTLPLPSQVAEMKSQIKAASEKLEQISSNRHAIIGVTAEQFADKKSNEKFIFDNIYQDSECQKKLFAPDEYDELGINEIGVIISAINSIVAAYAESYLKKAGLSRLVQDLISISDGDAMRFYGVPAIKLTYYQIELLNYGKWFKHIFSDPKKRPPAHIQDDPDLLIEWSTGQENASSIINSNAQNVAVVGATDEDIKAIAGENAVSMDSLIKKKGRMRGAEFAKALGYK